MQTRFIVEQVLGCTALLVGFTGTTHLPARQTAVASQAHYLWLISRTAPHVRIAAVR